MFNLMKLQPITKKINKNTSENIMCHYFVNYPYLVKCVESTVQYAQYYYC